MVGRGKCFEGEAYTRTNYKDFYNKAFLVS